MKLKQGKIYKVNTSVVMYCTEKNRYVQALKQEEKFAVLNDSLKPKGVGEIVKILYNGRIGFINPEEISRCTKIV